MMQTTPAPVADRPYSNGADALALGALMASLGRWTRSEVEAQHLRAAMKERR